MTEVMGRQFFCAKRFSEAKEWLEKARSAAITEHALLRRNVLIRLHGQRRVSETRLHKRAEGYADILARDFDEIASSGSHVNPPQPEMA